MNDCPACDGEPGNHCLYCGGTGEVPCYEEWPPDDYEDWSPDAVCPQNWSPEGR